MTHHADHTPSRSDCIVKLRELIQGVEVAMLTTVAPDGRLLSRPLETQQVEFDGNLWFASGYDSEKVHEIEANPQVNVSYASHDRNTYVSVAGRASVVRDRGTIERMWSPGMGLFFKHGKDDPNLCLIRVEAESAEYWDGPGSAIGKGLYFLTTAIKRDPGVMTDNRRVDLH